MLIKKQGMHTSKTSLSWLLMEKERKAWQSLLRVLSHEMNNSLTPIAAISQTMKSKLLNTNDEQQKESLLEGIGIINERASSLGEFIASYSQLAHLPKPNLSAFNLSMMIDKLATLYPICKVNSLIDPTLKVDVDKNQFEQVLINVFKNAVEAMNQLDEKLIEVSCKQEGVWLHIIIRDHGVGIANLNNVFVPFYTTKNKGSGIGLTLCRQIMFNHNGLIKLKNADEKSTGVVVTLSLPIDK
jgi:two-component system nitrogen regulation sensor histidine kinase NtrY